MLKFRDFCDCCVWHVRIFLQSNILFQEFILDPSGLHSSIHPSLLASEPPGIQASWPPGIQALLKTTTSLSKNTTFIYEFKYFILMSHVLESEDQYHDQTPVPIHGQT